MIEVRLLGPINSPGLKKVNESITFKQLLEQYGGGFIQKYPRAVIMQVGGPLGKIVWGNRINDRVSDHIAEIRTAKMVSFFGDRFCPIDFLRFLTRFLMREIQLDTPHIRAVYRIIIKISGSQGSLEHLEQLRDFASIQDGLSYGEYRLGTIINDLMDIYGNDFVEHAVEKYCHFSVCRLLFNRNAPCSNTCPSNMHVPGYIELIKNDRLDDALTLMKQDNPLSFVCGKICPAPCEKRCRQGDISGTSVAIRQLKRFIADNQLNSETATDSPEYIKDCQPLNGKRVTIIGGGPAGISAAFYLAKTGYEVTIYEANDRLGGMLAYGIPEYRLPYKTVEAELVFLQQIGIKIVLNAKIGENIPLKKLRNENHAVLLATGRWIGRTFGPSISQIEPAIKFLREVKLGERKTIPKKVVVIGGGAVAIDVAMSAVRLGAKTTIVALEERDKMLADEEEIHEAIEDGVQLLNGWSTKEFIIKNGVLQELELQRCLSVFDDNYNPALAFDSIDTQKIETDFVVTAIGQAADFSYLDEDIKINESGNIIIDAAFQTVAKGIFIAGEMKAPGLVISAIGEGKRASMAIDSYLGGKGIYFGREIEIPETLLDPRIWDVSRQQAEKASPSMRKGNFIEVESTFSKEQALCETRRCMRCDCNSIQELYLKGIMANS